MRETAVEKRLKDRIETDLGGMCLKLIPWFHRGLPDRLCLLPGGYAFFVETKAPSGRVRAVQQRRKDQLQALGFRVHVTYTKGAVDQLIDDEASKTRRL